LLLCARFGLTLLCTFLFSAFLAFAGFLALIITFLTAFFIALIVLRRGSGYTGSSHHGYQCQRQKLFHIEKIMLVNKLNEA